MVCDLRSHAGTNNIPTYLARLVADELAQAAQGERDNPDGPRPVSLRRGGHAYRRQSTTVSASTQTAETLG